MKRIQRVVLAAALAAAPLTVAPGASAAFPGRNGRIVFEYEAPAGDHTQTDLYSINPDGSGLRRLTNTPDLNEFGAAWNPAGTRIAFWRTKAPFGTGAVWVMNAGGGSPRQLTHGIDARDPAWDPTGTRIVFTRYGPGGSHLWTMRASDGGDLRQLTFGPVLDFEPAWSPNGRLIAFTRGFEQGDVGDIYVLNVATRKLRHLTATAAYDHQVNWAPRGDRLVFERDYARSSSLFTVAAGGGPVHRLTTGAYFDVGPAFSPDGCFVAFSSDRGGTPLNQLWVMRSDGTGLRRVHRLAFSEGLPDWQPLPLTPA